MRRPIRIAFWTPLPLWDSDGANPEVFRRCQALAVAHEFLFLSEVEPKGTSLANSLDQGILLIPHRPGWLARRRWEAWNQRWKPDLWHVWSWNAACVIAQWSGERNPSLPVLAELSPSDLQEADGIPPEAKVLPDMATYGRNWQEKALREQGLAAPWACYTPPALEMELFTSYHPDPRIGRREWTLPEDGFFFVTVCGPGRGISLEPLLDAVKNLDRKHPFKGFRLVILHPEAESLEESITARGLAHRVFLRKPPVASAAVALPAQRAGLFRSMDVFVGIHTGTVEERGLLEGMAAELPMVLVEKPALLELAGSRDHAVFVEEGNSGELEAAMESLMVDKEKRARLSYASRARAMAFSSTAVTGEWADTYARLLQVAG